MRGTGAASFTAVDGKQWRPTTAWKTSDTVPCRLRAYCCRTLRLEVIRLASRWSWRASTHRVPVQVGEPIPGPHPLQELWVVNLETKLFILNVVFVVPIRRIPIGTTTMLIPDHEGGEPQHQTALHEIERAISTADLIPLCNTVTGLLNAWVIDASRTGPASKRFTENGCSTCPG